MAVPIQAGDRGQIDGIGFGGIVRDGRIVTVEDRLVAVDDHDLDQLEAAVLDEAPGLTEGSGYGSNQVTIVFDIVTFSPFLNPSGMLGFLTLASPERVGFPDGKKELYGRADCVRATAG